MAADRNAFFAALTTIVCLDLAPMADDDNEPTVRYERPVSQNRAQAEQTVRRLPRRPTLRLPAVR